MKIKEITVKKDKELASDLAKIKNNLIKSRFEVAAKETNQHTEIGKLRKDIARIKTIIREREIQREEEKDEEKA